MEGNQTVAELARRCDTQRSNVVASIKVLKDTNNIKSAGIRDGKTNREKPYQITNEGIYILFDYKKISPEQFWQIMFMNYTAKKNKKCIRYDELFRYYEEKILNIKLKNVPALWGNSVKNLSEIHPYPLTGFKLLVLYVLGIHGPLSFGEIIKKYGKKHTSLSNEIIDINENALESMVNENIIFRNKENFQISASGLVLLLTNLNTVHEGEDEQMKIMNIRDDLKKILKNSCDIIPYFSKLCEKIPAIVSSRILDYFGEIFNQLTNTVGPIQLQGTKELIILERVMEEVNRSKIFHESNIGHRIREKLIQEKKIQDVDSPIYDKLKYLARISGDPVENTDKDSEKAISNKIDVKIEKAISNKIDFELFCYFLQNVQNDLKTDQDVQKDLRQKGLLEELKACEQSHNKKKLNAWKQFHTENIGFRNWFNSWIDDITKFEEKNLQMIKDILLR